MGQCIYCGQPAGIFKQRHKECTQRHEQGKSEIVSLVSEFCTEGGDTHELERLIERVASTSFIDRIRLRSLLVSGWENAVNSVLDDELLSDEEESALTKLKDHFSLSQQLLDENGAYSKVVKGAVLREIMNGNLPERMKIDGGMPFNLQKSEKVVWMFQGVKYFEEKTRTRYVGGSQGVSIRIARGLYYRTGSFRGERVQSAETLHADTGLLAVTNKHIYFAGSSKRFRIAYGKIVSFEQFSDGIGVQRDAQTARPQSFQTGDGWFTYNLITNLAQM